MVNTCTHKARCQRQIHIEQETEAPNIQCIHTEKVGRDPGLLVNTRTTVCIGTLFLLVFNTHTAGDRDT